ncbi:MAG: hypothetical protein RL232_399 [Actinomycetota bacterium]
MNSIPNSAGFTLPGGKIGVLVIHGFTGSPVSIAPWAKFLNKSGYTVSAPLLPGHGSRWQQMNQTTWQDWYEEVEKSFLELKQSCDRVFIAGFSMGAALALRLCQIRGSEVEGLIVLNPSVHDRRWFMKYVPVLKFLLASVAKGPTDIAAPNPPIHAYDRTPLKALDSLRKLWALVERDLYLIDLPIMVAYSVNDHAVDPENAMTVIDNVFSVDIREVVFENSFHNVALDFDVEQLNIESKIFIEDVLISKNNIKIFKNKKIKTKNTHGTGCTLSSAIASFISKNYNMNESCRRSIQYVHKAILLNPKFGRGHGPINHMALLN